MAGAVAAIAAAEQAASLPAVVKKFTDKDLPGVGAYLDIHWMHRHVDGECSRAPGPIDYQYTALISLTPADARALGARDNDWLAASPDAQPELAALMPDHSAWVTSQGYGDRELQGKYWGTLDLDPNDNLALFTFGDH